MVINLGQKEIRQEEKESLLKGLKHGWRQCFENCSLLMEALSYEDEVPASFWEDEEKGLYGILGYYNVPKKTLKKLRVELIDFISAEINENTMLLPDHYGRLFHALTILKVSKKTKKFKEKDNNLFFNSAYHLWKIDKGNAWEEIDYALWCYAETAKNNY